MAGKVVEFQRQLRDIAGFLNDGICQEQQVVVINRVEAAPNFDDRIRVTSKMENFPDTALDLIAGKPSSRIVFYEKFLKSSPGSIVGINFVSPSPTW